MGVLSVTKQVGGYVLGDGVHVAATLTPFGQDVDTSEVAKALADYLNQDEVQPILGKHEVYFRIRTDRSTLCIRKDGLTIPITDIAGDKVDINVMGGFVGTVCPARLHEKHRRANGSNPGARHAPFAPRQ